MQMRKLVEFRQNANALWHGTPSMKQKMQRSSTQSQSKMQL